MGMLDAKHICPKCGCFTDVSGDVREFDCPRTTCKAHIVIGWSWEDTQKGAVWPKYYDQNTRLKMLISC